MGFRPFSKNRLVASCRRSWKVRSSRKAGPASAPSLRILFRRQPGPGARRVARRPKWRDELSPRPSRRSFGEGRTGFGEPPERAGQFVLSHSLYQKYETGDQILSWSRSRARLRNVSGRLPYGGSPHRFLRFITSRVHQIQFLKRLRT